MKDPNRFYTYAYLREDRTPYYIGKGEGRRAYKKRKVGVNSPKDKSRIIFLKQNLTEEDAFKHEKYMIAVFGRKDLGTGILHNKTDGGDGVSGRVVSMKERKNISERMKGKNHPLYGKKGKPFQVKSFSVISHTGEIIHYENITQFCRDNDLNKGNFSQVLSGKRQSHKGFRLHKGEDTFQTDHSTLP